MIIFYFRKFNIVLYNFLRIYFIKKLNILLKISFFLSKEFFLI